VPEFERSRQCHLVLYALCDECAVGLMKGHFVDDGALATEFNNESLQFEYAEPSLSGMNASKLIGCPELEQRPFDRPPWTRRGRHRVALMSGSGISRSGL
jgi:hypothetical protein